MGRENKNTKKPQTLEAKISFLDDENESLKPLFLQFYKSALEFLGAIDTSKL